MATTFRRLALILLLSGLLAGIAFAQEGEAPAAAKPTFGLGLGIGVQTFNEPSGSVTYQSLSLSPDLAFGKFGIGLAVTLNYRFTGAANSFEVRLADWWPQAPDPVTFQTVAAIYLPKISYVRWGEKGDPLFVKLGSINDSTLGNGFIVGNYANTLFLPSNRLFGLNFDMDGSLFGFPYVGLETMTGNLAELDVIGGRLYVRPLAGTKIPILKNLEFGGTVAADREPDLYYATTTAAAPVLAFGGDVRLPVIFIKNVFSLVTFGDVASTPKGASDRAWGGMVGLGGKFFSFLTYGAQLRMLGDDFIPVYFDATYDLLRNVQYDLVQATGFSDASMGWMASLGTSFFDDKFVFKVSLDAPFVAPVTDPADLSAIVKNPHLRGTFTIGEGIIPGLPGISLDASYDKKGITDFTSTPPGGLFNPTNAAIQAKLNYKSGPAVLSFVYKVRYEPPATPDDTPWVVTSGLESSIQLF
ncbi:MAG: hypothetical protein NT005_12000 [Spirochaetes bacterium]|nr:hypothetical protein [Spirochaetota bacterium]